MQPFLLLAVAFGLSHAIQCPNGFTDDGSGSCFFTVNQESQYSDARQWCALQNSSFLYDIKNAFENSKVQSFGKPYETVWLGLTCLTNLTTSCLWDDGRALRSSDYTNFYGGAPNADAGACVVMLVSTGKWYSSSCNQKAYFGCQFTPGTTVETCADPRTNYFRGQCYNVLYSVSMAVDRAQGLCQEYCGNLASIHSAGENSFVRDLSQYQDSSYTLLGLKSNKGSYYWLDGSPYNYYGFGYQNPSLGPCVSMALQDDVVFKGKWINSQCSISGPNGFVCKKDVVTDCDVPPVTTAAPTLSPMECTAPIYKTGSGDLYSPGYPRPSDPNTCEYLITEDDGNQASITFQDVVLDRNSYIYLYGNFMDKSPFATLTNTNYNSKTYYSSTNILKIVFNTTGASINYFHGVFNGGETETTTVTAPDSCGQWNYDQTTLQSPNYPGSYPLKNRNCSNYYVSYYYDGACIVFDMLNIRNGDYIDLIDYNSGDRFQRLHYATPDQIFCSPREASWGAVVTVDFVTSTVNNYPSNVMGYSARFGGRQELGFTEAPEVSQTEPTMTTMMANTETLSSVDMNCNGGNFYYDGYFSSPNYDSEYPPNLNCGYMLYSDKNYILLEFKDFYTENNVDFVYVYDGNGFLLAKLSGPKSGYQVRSNLSSMRVVFITDSTVQFRGFLAKFTSV